MDPLSNTIDAAASALAGATSCQSVFVLRDEVMVFVDRPTGILRGGGTLNAADV